MKNNQFSPMTEKEMTEVNGGGLVTDLLGGIPLVGPILSSLLSPVIALLNSLGLPLPL